MQGNYSKSMGAPKVPKVEWSDIGGLDDVKAEIIKTVQLPLKHPEYFTISGLKRSGCHLRLRAPKSAHCIFLRYFIVRPSWNWKNAHSESRCNRM